MENFLYHIPTKIYFGKGQISELGESIKPYGNKVLLVYGGGSIKKIGLYDAMIKILKEENIEYYELSGVDPNPRLTMVNDGAKLCRDKKIDVVLAIGGGSAIDCAKAVAASASYMGDAWDLISGKASISSVLPIISILTLAATGSEMDTNSVISNMDTQEKKAFSHKDMRPVVSILDPEYSYSVSKYQTAAGTADIMCHVMEDYFNNNTGAYLQNRFCEAILKTAIHYGKEAVENPHDYEGRANLMWAGSWAINGLLSAGNPSGWSAHAMEHELSAYYDITHGAGLAILIPHWLRYMMGEENMSKYVDYGVEVWGINKEQEPRKIAEQAIDATALYFKSMNLPTSLREIGIDDKNFEIMAKKAGAHLDRAFIPMNERDVLNIYKMAL
ncbi:MAG: iron-containing alcohol dehydrogenase [Acetivibrio sp.]